MQLSKERMEAVKLSGGVHSYAEPLPESVQHLRIEAVKLSGGVHSYAELSSRVSAALTS